MIIGSNGADNIETAKRDRTTSLKAAQSKDVIIYGALIIAAVFAYTSLVHTSKGSPRY